jgi:hypothetical protein
LPDAVAGRHLVCFSCIAAIKKSASKFSTAGCTSWHNVDFIKAVLNINTLNLGNQNLNRCPIFVDHYSPFWIDLKEPLNEVLELLAALERVGIETGVEIGK